MSTLLDLGEREILRTLIPKFANGAGDDCAVIETSAGQFVVTTDPVPPPAAHLIGQDDDPYWMGWLLVTINVSDLAAAGARPLGFVAAIEAEASRSVESFERLFLGVSDCCKQAGIPYVGGNIRESSKLSGVGTAFGICDNYPALTRRGAADGDLVISVGAGGTFWRDATRLLAGAKLPDKLSSNVFSPRSQIQYMSEFARRGLISAAMDNSDGLLPTLAELASKNGLGIELNLDFLTVSDVAAENAADGARFWFGWGDWNVIACVSPNHFQGLQHLADRLGADVREIGQISNKFSNVVMRRGGVVVPAPRLESERFSRDSWMTIGISEYVRLLREVQIP